MHRRARSGCLISILVAVVGGCSSVHERMDAGGADSDAGDDDDGSTPDEDAAPDDAAPSDAAPADAAPDAAPKPDAPVADCGRIKCDCTFEGIRLFGRVQYVTSFPMITVSETAFPDLRVREGSFADSCGEWEIVTSFPDFTVQVVDAFEDFGIEYSDFPGIPR